MQVTMRKKICIAGLSVSLTALAACAPSSDAVYTQFYREPVPWLTLVPSGTQT